MKISVVLITLNEERNLPRALESVRGLADEVVVVDSRSTDRTREIAMAAGARVIAHDWEGYSGQKIFAAAEAANDWVLSLDADESLSDGLCAEIVAIKQQPPTEAAGYSMPRLAHYLGRWIRHSGWYPDRKVRLFDRRRARWTGELVHESVAVEGPVVRLNADLLHYTCDSVEDHGRTLERYTTLAARQARAAGVRWALARRIVLPPWKFLETYLFRLGFLDGYPGWVIARMAARYVYRKYAKLSGLRQDSQG